MSSLIVISAIEMVDNPAFLLIVECFSSEAVCELTAFAETYFKRGMRLSGWTEECDVMINIPPISYNVFSSSIVVTFTLHCPPRTA